MKLGNYEIIYNGEGKFAIVNIEKRVREVYIKGNSESAYLCYRNITGATVQESWAAVKPWIKLWNGEGKKHGI